MLPNSLAKLEVRLLSDVSWLGQIALLRSHTSREMIRIDSSYMTYHLSLLSCPSLPPFLHFLVFDTGAELLKTNRLFTLHGNYPQSKLNEARFCFHHPILCKERCCYFFFFLAHVWNGIYTLRKIPKVNSLFAPTLMCSIALIPCQNHLLLCSAPLYLFLLRYDQSMLNVSFVHNQIPLPLLSSPI